MTLLCHTVVWQVHQAYNLVPQMVQKSRQLIALNTHVGKVRQHTWVQAGPARARRRESLATQVCRSDASPPFQPPTLVGGRHLSTIVMTAGPFSSVLQCTSARVRTQAYTKFCAGAGVTGKTGDIGSTGSFLQHFLLYVARRALLH